MYTKYLPISATTHFNMKSATNTPTDLFSKSSHSHTAVMLPEGKRPTKATTCAPTIHRVDITFLIKMCLKQYETLLLDKQGSRGCGYDMKMGCTSNSPYKTVTRTVITSSSQQVINMRACFFFSFHIRTVHLDIINVIYSTTNAFPDSVYFRTVQHTHINKGKSNFDTIYFNLKILLIQYLTHCYSLQTY